MTMPSARVLPIRSPAAWCTAALVLALGPSCTTTTRNGEHCYYNAGNATCAERHDGALPYCAFGCSDSPNGDGCVDAEPSGPCYSPCGGEQNFAEDNTCLDVAGTDTTTPSSTGPTDDGPTGTDDADTTQGTSPSTTDDTGPLPCDTSGDCPDGTTPICSDYVCVACTSTALPDAECAAKDPDLPACGVDGDCVVCTAANPLACPESAPVCDDEACRGCVAHDECSSAACEFESGECFSTLCSLDVPGDHDTLQAAVDEAIDAAAPCVIHVTDDVVGVDLAHTVTVASGMEVAIVGAGAAPFQVTGGSAPTLHVIQGATVYLAGLRIGGSVDALGVQVVGAGSMLYVDDSEVVDNNGGGVSIETGARLQVRNSMIGGAADLAALALSGNSQADILYTTVVGATGDASVLVCPGTANVTVRNSFLVGRGPADLDISCDADVTYSATEALVDGTGNVALGDLTLTNQNQWFINYGAANYHLAMPPDELLTTARWQDGDPIADLDGDPRPAVDDAMDVAGADVP